MPHITSFRVSIQRQHGQFTEPEASWGRRRLWPLLKLLRWGFPKYRKRCGSWAAETNVNCLLHFIVGALLYLFAFGLTHSIKMKQTSSYRHKWGSPYDKTSLNDTCKRMSFVPHYTLLIRSSSWAALPVFPTEPRWHLAYIPCFMHYDFQI